MQILYCCQSPSHCFPPSGDRELTTAGNARRREEMKRTRTDLFLNPPKLIWVWLNTERAFLCQLRGTAGSWGGCYIDKKTVSLFSRILSITIIRRYFAECVIVLILRTTVHSWLWYSSYSVWWSVHSSDRNESFPISLNRFLPFMVIFTIRPVFLKVCMIIWVKFFNLISHLEKDIWAVIKQNKSVSTKFIFEL